MTKQCVFISYRVNQSFAIFGNWMTTWKTYFHRSNRAKRLLMVDNCHWWIGVLSRELLFLSNRIASLSKPRGVVRLYIDTAHSVSIEFNWPGRTFVTSRLTDDRRNWFTEWLRTRFLCYSVFFENFLEILLNKKRIFDLRKTNEKLRRSI